MSLANRFAAGRLRSPGPAGLWRAAGVLAALAAIAALSGVLTAAPPPAAPAAGAGPAEGGNPAMTAVAAHGAGPAAGGPLRFLFIHHSVGGQLLADPGELVGGDKGSAERCIHVSHPNGGGLRARLEALGYEVHEASYGSRIGEDTDIHHWRNKFAGQMDEILRCDRNDRLYEDGRRNHIVAFKSCFPNSDFRGAGSEPGEPDSPELTLANAQAAYRSLLPLLQQQPDVLFVVFTAPSFVEPKPVGMRAKLRGVLGGKPKSAELARQFNNWLADRERGWLADYPLRNVAVFDYYDVLTGGGASNWLVYPTRGGTDSHPSAEGNRKAAEAFLPVLEQAVAGMGLRARAAQGSLP